MARHDGGETVRKLSASSIRWSGALLIYSVEECMRAIHVSSRESPELRDRSEIPGEGALDRMGLRVRGEFALIERTELGLRGKAPVKAGFDQRRIARDRDAGNREARTCALEG